MNNMSLKLTKKDMLLLYVLFIAIAVFVFIYYILTPSMDRMKELDTSIQAAEDEMFSMQVGISGLAQVKVRNEELKTTLEALKSEFTPTMNNWEFSEMFYEIQSSFGLVTRSFSMSGLDSLTGRQIPFYVNAVTDGDTAYAAVPDIATVTANLSVSGTDENIMSFVDCILSKAPAMRVISYSLGAGSLSMSIEVYMVIPTDY